jgi:hypothetical protein
MGKRYEKEQAEKMKQVITVLKRVSPTATQVEIAEALNKRGFKTTVGKEFTGIAVHNFMKNHNTRFVARRRKNHHPILPRHLEPKPDDSLQVAQVIIAAQLDEVKKKNLLRSIFA